MICGYYCLGFTDFMLKGKSLLDYTNLFSPKKYEQNDKLILKYCVISAGIKKYKSIIKKQIK